MKMVNIFITGVLLIVFTHSLYADDSIVIKQDLLYDKYTLEKDTYAYNKTTRVIQWDVIKKCLRRIDNFEHQFMVNGILQNYKNKNGHAPLVKNFKKTKWNRYTDSLGVKQNQGIPLYDETDFNEPVLYARDGSYIAIVSDTLDFYKVAIACIKGEWYVPRKYVYDLGPVRFNKVIVIDRTNQNIVTLEHVNNEWLVRSKNPATTGLEKPPFKSATPVGIFVLQNKLYKMIYLEDGSDEVAGYAPYANRISDGAYIHGIPVNLPHTEMIEYSSTLGTTPRSHMCVRNATSHAKFIYDWAPKYGALVCVIE